jgi:hypothetical protein
MVANSAHVSSRWIRSCCNHIFLCILQVMEKSPGKATCKLILRQNLFTLCFVTQNTGREDCHVPQLRRRTSASLSAVLQSSTRFYDDVVLYAKRDGTELVRSRRGSNVVLIHFRPVEVRRILQRTVCFRTGRSDISIRRFSLFDGVGQVPARLSCKVVADRFSFSCTKESTVFISRKPRSTMVSQMPF